MNKGFCLFLASICFIGTIAAMGQQGNWTVRLTLPQKEYLPGEPIIGLTIEIENVGPNPSHFPGFKGNLFLDEAKTPCTWKGLFVDTIPADKSTVVHKKEEILEEVGATHVTTWTIDIANYCGLADENASFYGGHALHYRYPEHLGNNIAESSTQFTIKNPVGSDKEAYDYFKGKPLSKPAELLQKFPTSTYAGYELAKCAKENLQDYVNMSYEDIDEVLGVRGLIAEKQDAYRKERKKYFEEKLKLLQEFIAVHPEFVKADMIRSGISFYLLILGRQNEAIEEMKLLEKMDGRWAEGAKKALSLTCQKDEKVKVSVPGAKEEK